MASNPMKRRARQAFCVGFLLALVVMAVVVVFLLSKINSLNEENEKLKVVGPKINVYTINKDIKEGEVISVNDLQPSTMQLAANATAIDTSNYIDPSIFYKEDEETKEEKEITYTAKVEIFSGSVATLSMIKNVEIADDERLMEYTSIVLPSQLKNDDYVDIRLRLADGTEKIVLSKKRIVQCTQSAIWMKMKEIEILTLNSAIVDAYLVPGSQLRAVMYTEPLMQDASKSTYAVNVAVVSEISKNPNILQEAINSLSSKWFDRNGNPTSDYVAQRQDYESYIQDKTKEERADDIDSKYSEEASSISEARGEFVSALEETGMVGTTY